MLNPLTEAQLRHLREQLVNRLAELQQEVHEILVRSDEEHYLELAGRVHDLEDQSLATLLVDVNLADVDRHVQEIREVEEALGRMAQASFGICRHCQQPIEYERLLAAPTAERCVTCQAEYERTHRQPAHPTL